MIASSSSFINSTIIVDQNAVKSILFRCAAILLQLAAYKCFSLLAFKLQAFTSYLMFTEGYAQKALFIISRGFSRCGFLVLCLTILLSGAGLFDTLLWGLDAPGYLAEKDDVKASSIADQLVEDPSYIILSSSMPGEVAPLEQRLTYMMGSNLFETGVNFSLTGEFDHGIPKVVPATKPITETGPRIWLDHEGFSVSPDSWITFAVSPDTNASKDFECPWYVTGDRSKGWNCTFDNYYALPFLTDVNLGRPEVHWDDGSDNQLMSQWLSPRRTDNPWTSLGTGGDTAMMKQMFTVTKGRERHTFIVTAFKTCMITDWDAPFSLGEVTDIVQRSWSTDPAQQNNPTTHRIADSIITAREQNSSFIFGFNYGEDFSVSQANYELLNAEATPDVIAFSLLRISVVNITLVRSDILPESVKPFEPCDKFYMNEAIGGKVYGTNCYKKMSGNQTNHHFFGQVDASAILILNGLLGDGRFNISQKGLDQAGFKWVGDNEQTLNNLLLSRGFIMALDPDFVTVEVSQFKPAMSYLQISLVILAAFFAILGWVSLSTIATRYYTSSLLANLLATTDMDRSDSRRPRYLFRMPDIWLGEKGSRVIMQTPTGVFRLDPDIDAGTPEVFKNLL
jgi:hypothetical protein